MKLIYERLDPNAYAPTKAFPEDAGWDIRSLSAYSIRPGETLVIPTGLAIKLQPTPEQKTLVRNLGFSWYWRAADKSGLASKYGIHVLGGVIDYGYVGAIGIILANLGFWADGRMVHNHWHVEPGDKIAQIIPELIADCREAVEGAVGSSDRGAGGFGSTGR